MNLAALLSKVEAALKASIAQRTSSLAIDTHTRGYHVGVLIDVRDTSADGSFLAQTLGPVWTRDHNERGYGVFPLGCDVCVARQSPPCGMLPGRDGCKAGSQYQPDVPCQYQGTSMGGQSPTSVRVTLLEGQPTWK